MRTVSLIAIAMLAACGKTAAPQVATAAAVVATVPKGDPVEGARIALAENGGGLQGIEEAAAVVTILSR